MYLFLEWYTDCHSRRIMMWEKKESLYINIARSQIDLQFVSAKANFVYKKTTCKNRLFSLK